MSVVSVHLADVGTARTLKMATTRTGALKLDGLRHADLGIAQALSTSTFPRPELGRVGFIGFWDDDAAIDAFVRTHPIAEQLAHGWHARLEPLRVYGAWPGIDEDLTQSRHTDHAGPAVVITLGKMRFLRATKFLRASTGASASALEAPGRVWSTAMTRPPFVATVSLWESSKAIATYAYGRKDQGHPEAMEASERTPFHHRQAFVRFRPYRVEGSLEGKNPLAATAISAAP